MKHDFAFGDTRGIRKIMVAKAEKILEQGHQYEMCGYPPHEGDEELLVRVRALIHSLTGKWYKHVIITNGATHAINAYIYAVKLEDETEALVTSKLYFSFYRGIARINGLRHEPSDLVRSAEALSEALHSIGIVDSPSNPLGHLTPWYYNGDYTLWDAAYYSPTYCGVIQNDKLVNPPIQPHHNAMAGSLNKLTGLNGLRVGWLATDDDNVYYSAASYVTNTLCGVSYPSQWIAKEILHKVDLDAFYKESKALLDSNRTEMQRLDRLFGGQAIPPNGMFALYEVDDKLAKLLEKAEVLTMPGQSLGDSRNSVRFNLANDSAATKLMVDAVLKADRKK